MNEGSDDMAGVPRPIPKPTPPDAPRFRRKDLSVILNAFVKARLTALAQAFGVLRMTKGKWLFLLSTIIISWNGIHEISAASEEYKFYPKMAATLHSHKWKGEELVISAPHPHRYELGIKTPSGNLLSVYSILYDDIPMDNPNEIINFWEANTISFQLADLRGFYYEDGRPVATKVFTEPGLYCLHFSSNFETHPEDTYYSIIDIQWPSPTPMQIGKDNGKCQDDFFTGE